MSESTPEQRARRRAEEVLGLMWHVATYLVIVPFLFFLDWRVDHTIDWAYWAALPWGIGLVFHTVSYFIGPRFRDRAYERFLAEELAKESKQ